MNGNCHRHRCCTTNVSYCYYHWNSCCVMKKSGYCYCYKKNDCYSNFWTMNCCDMHFVLLLHPCVDKKNRNDSPYYECCFDDRRTNSCPVPDECIHCWNDRLYLPSQSNCCVLSRLNAVDEPMKSHL